MIYVAMYIANTLLPYGASNKEFLQQRHAVTVSGKIHSSIMSIMSIGDSSCPASIHKRDLN